MQTNNLDAIFYSDTKKLSVSLLCSCTAEKNGLLLQRMTNMISLFLNGDVGLIRNNAFILHFFFIPMLLVFSSFILVAVSKKAKTSKGRSHALAWSVFVFCFSVILTFFYYMAPLMGIFYELKAEGEM